MPEIAFSLSLNNVFSATLGVATATLVIADDDGPQHRVYLPLVLRSQAIVSTSSWRGVSSRKQ